MFLRDQSYASYLPDVTVPYFSGNAWHGSTHASLAQQWRHYLRPYAHAVPSRPRKSVNNAVCAHYALMTHTARIAMQPSRALCSSSFCATTFRSYPLHTWLHGDAAGAAASYHPRSRHADAFPVYLFNKRGLGVRRAAAYNIPTRPHCLFHLGWNIPPGRAVNAPSGGARTPQTRFNVMC